MRDRHHSSKTSGLSRFPLVREFLAELLSTFVLVLCINGTSAQRLLSEGKFAEFLACRVGDGFGGMAGVLIGGGVSGAHMNPAVTFGFACSGKFPWRKVIPYWIAQYIGAFAAAACVFAWYFEAIMYKTGGVFEMTETDPGLAAIFATYPATYLSLRGAIVDQIVGTALLMACISAIIDQKNCHVPLYYTAFYVGMLIMCMGICFSMNCGAPLNPARDFSPRLFSYIIGWGPSVFSYDNWMWFWIPLAIPHAGAVLGVFVYILFIEAHLPEETTYW